MTMNVIIMKKENIRDEWMREDKTDIYQIFL